MAMEYNKCVPLSEDSLEITSIMSPVPENERTRDSRIADQDRPEYTIHTSSSDSDGVEFMLDHGPDTYGYTVLPQDADGPLFNTQLQDDEDDENVYENGDELTLDTLITQHLDRDDLVHTGTSSQIDDSKTQLPDSVWNKAELQNSIPMDEENKDAIMKAMIGFKIPLANHPEWATGIMEESWKEQLLSQIQQKTDISLHTTKEEGEKSGQSNSNTGQSSENVSQTHNQDTAD